MRSIALRALTVIVHLFGRIQQMLEAFWNTALTLTMGVNLFITFRHEIANRNNFDAYLADRRNAAKLQRKISRLGCAAMKTAQWISQRLDMMPPNVVACLEVFQKAAPSHPYSTTMDEIERGLSASAGSGRALPVFTSVESTVLGSGSISQVHRCKLQGDDRPAVVKVMHPEAREDIVSKSSQFLQLFRLMGWLVPEMKMMNLTSIYDTLLLQTDYTLEVRNQERVRDVIGCLGFVVVPEVYHHTDRFIVQQECRGLTRQQLAVEYPEYLIDMAEKTSMAYVWMVYNGFVHPDLHDGNTLFIVDPEDDANNKLVILDFGLNFELVDKGFDALCFVVFEALIKREQKLLARTLTRCIDTAVYSEREARQVVRALQTGNFFSKHLATSSMEEVSKDFLGNLNKTGIVLKTPELYSLLGFQHISRQFRDNDGDLYDVSLAALHRMSRHSDAEIARCGQRFLDLQVMYRDTAMAD